MDYIFTIFNFCPQTDRGTDPMETDSATDNNVPTRSARRSSSLNTEDGMEKMNTH